MLLGIVVISIPKYIFLALLTDIGHVFGGTDFISGLVGHLDY